MPKNCQQTRYLSLIWIFLLGCSFASWSSCTTGMFCLIYITPEQQPYSIKESSNSSKVIFQLLVSIIHNVSHILFRHEQFSVLCYRKFHTIGCRSDPQNDSPSEQNTALPKSGSNRQIQQLLCFLAISALNLQRSLTPFLHAKQMALTWREWRPCNEQALCELLPAILLE